MRITTLVPAVLLAFFIDVPAVPAQPDVTSATTTIVPAALEVPEGHVPYLKAFAAGTQNYVCLPAGGTVGWKFLGPQATLFFTLPCGFRQQVTTHFLSLNPAEPGVARPTWQHSFDSSQVWGRVVASSTDPDVVAPGAIPWLLLEAAGTARGPEGGVALVRTTYIQRIETAGGLMPSTSCASPADIGRLALVPYTTTYVFHRAARRF